VFNAIKTRLHHMKILRAICEGAERHALADQCREPGAEHFMLAAIDLPDGTARLAFEQIGADPEAFRSAIQSQYAEALAGTGIDLEWLMPDPLPLKSGVYRAAPSGAGVISALSRRPKTRSGLQGADVVAVIAAMDQGVSARALRSINVDRAALSDAAERMCLV
jgi:hypothetical protein